MPASLKVNYLDAFDSGRVVMPDCLNDMFAAHAECAQSMQDWQLKARGSSKPRIGIDVPTVISCNGSFK